MINNFNQLQIGDVISIDGFIYHIYESHIEIRPAAVVIFTEPEINLTGFETPICDYLEITDLADRYLTRNALNKFICIFACNRLKERINKYNEAHNIPHREILSSLPDETNNLLKIIEIYYEKYLTEI